MKTKSQNTVKTLLQTKYLITLLLTLFIAYPSFSQETEVFEEFKDTERYKTDTTQKKILKMKISKDTSKQLRLRHRSSVKQNVVKNDSLVRHRFRDNQRNCDSNDVFIDKDGDGINDNRVKGMGLGKRKGLGKGLGKGKCKQQIK